ncbi:hypothetical protein Ae201684P_012922 [Aphanomyces euteiches]|nr:hypothetical protein Ae201684P_012922 [Aphanomyces euteiches]
MVLPLLTSTILPAPRTSKAADYTIVAIGERTYAEQSGNSDPLELPSGMTDYVKQLATTGTKIILVLVEGRPRLLNGIAELASAVVYAGLPCELGGEAIADLIFGKINPSGKMSITYPKSSDQLNMGTAYYGRQGDNCVLHHFHILQHATQCDVALAIEQQSDSVGDCR